MDEKRFEAIEIRMTHLENYLNQLNEIVLENGRLMEAMKKDQTLLRQQLSELPDQMSGPQDAKPPHY
ncbi:MAG: SlyX family protein [Spirochaetia bacterium]|jgi:uncharacterized coiled-coil protein SlyX|nr:SlyX family protein [Spirochaetia bacterium]